MKKIFTILGVVAAATFMNAQNLVQNPGFESGVLTPWVKGGTSYTEPTMVNSGAHSGTYYAAYNGATGTTGFMQDITITGGAVYTVSFWYKATGDGTDGRIWSVFKDAGGALLYLAGDSSTTATGAQLDPLRGPNNGYLPESATWTQHTVTFTSPATATLFQFAVRAYNNSTNVSFDDFSLVAGTMGTIDFSKDKFSIVKNTMVNEEVVFAKNVKDVKVYNMLGQVVKTLSVKEGEAVNVSDLASGNYIVTGTVNNEAVSQKVIKK